MKHCVLHRRVSTRRDARGAAAVEFAIIAPILIMLVFAIISYGFMLSFRQAMSQAAAEGARAAAVQPLGVSTADRTTAAINAVSDTLGSYGVSCVNGNLLRNGADVGACTVSAPGACTTSVGSATCVKVELVYEYRKFPLVPAIGLGFALPSELTYASEVRVS